MTVSREMSGTPKRPGPSIDKEILAFSRTLTAWQSDLLRRCVARDIIDPLDVAAYADQAFVEALVNKAGSEVGEAPVPESRAFLPISAENLQSSDSVSPPTVLHSIDHESGVNALAPGQSLTFAPQGLTVVCGNNGSGKSGYSRIAKAFAASRGPESILPNVYRETGEPSASLTWSAGNGGEAQTVSLADIRAMDVPNLRRVRVFDSRAAPRHLGRSEEIAWLPPALEALSDYTRNLGRVADELRLRSSIKGPSGGNAVESLAGGPLADTITKLGTPDGIAAINHVMPLSTGESDRLRALPDEVAELRQAEPARRAKQARVRASAMAAHAGFLSRASTAFSGENFAILNSARAEVLNAKSAVAEVASRHRHHDVLGLTTAPSWNSLWRATQALAQETKNAPFPAAAHEGHCLLCQQDLDGAAHARLVAFRDFTTSDASTQLGNSQELHKRVIEELKSFECSPDRVTIIASEIAAYDDTLGNEVTRALQEMNDASAAIPLEPSDVHLAHPEATSALLSRLALAAEGFTQREVANATALEDTDSNAARAQQLESELEVLRARFRFDEIRDQVREEHERRIEADSLGSAIKACATNAASGRARALAEQYAEFIGESFQAEVSRLGVISVPVRMTYDKVDRGVSYLRTELVGAESRALGDVLSEGERRVTALAAFLADFAGSGDNSALVFDDPVSSLDQDYRRAIATRLASEAVARQVIVFTHDYAFVRELHAAVDELKLRQVAGHVASAPEIEERYVARSSAGAGTLDNDAGWEVLGVHARIGVLKDRVQRLEALYKSGNTTAYRDAAVTLADLMRKTWERVVEEDLLNQAVTRHGRPMQTSRLWKLVDIEKGDIAAVALGMTVTSRCLHDGPSVDGSVAEQPAFFASEISDLDAFRAALRKRR